MNQEQFKQEAKTRFIKFIIWSATTASIAYLGYNLFSGEVMTTIDNWIATGTLTMAQAINAGLIIVNKLFSNGMTTIRQDNLSLSQENTEIKNELAEVRQENAQILEILSKQEERYNEAIKTEA